MVCLELGMGYGRVAQFTTFGQGNAGPIWLDEVRCSGTEQSLMECDHNDWGNTDW